MTSVLIVALVFAFWLFQEIRSGKIDVKKFTSAFGKGGKGQNGIPGTPWIWTARTGLREGLKRSCRRS